MPAQADREAKQFAHVFSKLELAQAAAFVLEAQRAERGPIMEPTSLLQIRYGIDQGRAHALAAQLERLGFWALFVSDEGKCCAQVLRG